MFYIYITFFSFFSFCVSYFILLLLFLFFSFFLLFFVIDILFARHDTTQHDTHSKARFDIVKELSVAEGNKYLQVADCVLSTVNLIGSYFHHSVDLVDTYTPYKVKQKSHE